MMKIVFYAADKPREHMLATALALGAKAAGDTLEIRRTADYGEALEGPARKYPGPTPDTDVAVCFGVKGRSRQIIEEHRGMKIATLFFDKGYHRGKGEGGHTEYSRISVNGSDPNDYMMLINRPDDRWKRLGFELKEFVKRPYGHVLICSSSEKYHDFHRLPSPHDYAVGLVSRLKKLCERQIIYRPKPSSTQSQLGVVDTEDETEMRAALEHYHAVMFRNKAVAGAAFSNGSSKMADALRGCHVVVTHGSAAAMDAIIAGVPAICLGRSIALPVAETVLENVEKPRIPNDAERYIWCRNMAYCQWTAPELRSGEAWSELKAEIVRQQSRKK
jgi:hypothetical protein